MAREFWRPLWLAWIATVWPLTAVLIAALWEYPGWAVLIVWWLKPVYDRVALYVISEALFGHVPGVSETLRALPRQLRSGPLSSLVWLRLSPIRSAALPVVQLERPALNEIEISIALVVGQPRAAAFDEDRRWPGGDVHQCRWHL